MATIEDLADELLLAMACLLPARDVCRLGATCRRIGRIVADLHLWRRLFVRDFAHLYEDVVDRSLLATCRAVGSWPPEARLLCERTGAISRMPPPCHYVADLPLPFTHAFAMAKDWPWLYRAHAVALDDRPHYTGPGTLATRPGMVRVGDWVDGQPVAYGVKIHRGGRAWSEKFARTPERTTWAISYNGYYARYRTDQYYAMAWPDSDRREWHAWGRDVVGDIKEWYGAHGIVVLADENAVSIKPLWQGGKHGVVRTRFGNGDTQAIRYHEGNFVEGIELVCSSSCPVAEYAGRALRCRWRRFCSPSHFSDYLIAADSSDQDSDDVRAFWHYVASGLVGWPDAVRRQVLATTTYSFCPKAVALEKNGYGRGRA